MKISIITLFPEMFVGPFSESIIKRGIEKGALHINIVQLRDFGVGKHKMVDDTPYGGGTGMLLKVDVMDAAIQAVKNHNLNTNEQQVILLDPRGETFQQAHAQSFSQLQHLLLLCGHYEGYDERIRTLVDQTISIGDFVLTGGELPAMLITDAVGRLVSGVLKEDATAHESFTLQKTEGVTRVESGPNGTSLAGKAADAQRNGVERASAGRNKRQDPVAPTLLEYPQYTMPSDYKGMKVPDILLSGHHGEIAKWRKEQAHKITQEHRPDLLKKD